MYQKYDYRKIVEDLKDEIIECLSSGEEEKITFANKLKEVIAKAEKNQSYEEY